MNQSLINAFIRAHSREYFKSVAQGDNASAKYHFGVMTGFLAALLTTGHLTAKEHMQLYKKYILGE